MSVTDLQGKTLTKIEWDSDSVRFFWEGGSARFDVFGDCCSITWIDSFDGAGDILGEPLVSVKQLDLPDATAPCGCRDERCDPSREWNHDSLALYGYRFETLKATATLDFRNDSNGYYGGGLVHAGEPATENP